MKRSIFQLFKKRLNLSFFLIFLIVPVVYGGEANDVRKVFEEAAIHYQKNDYQAAVDAYESILSKGAVSASLYCNLGNSYFKLGNIGKTILNYERALKLSPEDEELRHNLSFVRELLQDKVESSEPPPWLQKLTRLHHLLTLNGVLVIVSLCYIFILLCSSYAIVQPTFRRTFLRIIFVPLLSLFVFFLGLGVFKIMELRFSPAIVIAEQTDVYYGPSLHETKAFILHAGTKCSVREVSGEWMLIWLPNDRGGWVHQSGIERI